MRALLNNRPQLLLPLQERESDYVLAVDMQKIEGNVCYGRGLGENADAFLIINTEASLKPTKIRQTILS